MSFTQHSFDTKVQNLRTPTVLVAPQAMADMWDLTDLHRDEIGWLGSVRILARSQFLIEEIFLVEQRAHSATTEISEDGLAKLAEDLLGNRGDEGLDIVNRIRFWGHSHVNMGLTPSSQDESMLRKLAEDTGDYFIAARTNKRGLMRYDLLREDGLLITDIPWQVYAPADSRREHWQSEIKDKVRSISLVHSTAQGGIIHRTPGYQNRWDGSNTGPAQRERGSGPAGKASGGSGARGLPPIKKGGVTSGGASEFATNYDAQFNKPQYVDAKGGYYIDHFGRRWGIGTISDDELLAYGFCFFDDDSYIALPENIDIEQELPADEEGGTWVYFGATILDDENEEDDDPIDELYRLKILADEERKEESS